LTDEEEEVLSQMSDEDILGALKRISDEDDEYE